MDAIMQVRSLLSSHRGRSTVAALAAVEKEVLVYYMPEEPYFDFS